MPDREKVIEAPETCRDQDNPPGYRFTSCKSDCPYHGNGCARKLKEDALALLKEQETKLICNLLGGQPYEVYCRECRTMLCILGKGETMNDVKSIFSYCPHCGRSVK